MLLTPLTKTVYGYYSPNSNSTKIAAFDLDWTLIRPSSSRFSSGVSDFSLLPYRNERLKSLIDSGYQIVIFTNQQSKSKEKITTVLGRLENVLTLLSSYSVSLFVSLSDDEYRKPNRGMWDLFAQCSKFTPDQDSFYCGDADGSNISWSDSDIQFANTVGSSFLSPEQVFPSAYSNLQYYMTIPVTQTLIICVGMPGSGKSEFCRRYLTGDDPLSCKSSNVQGAVIPWARVNQDTLKTKERCLKEADKQLSLRKSVVIDNTNPSSEVRKLYLEIAVKYSVPVIILHFVRDGYSANQHREKPVPNIAYNMYFSKFVDPHIDTSLYNVPVIEIW